MGELVHRAGVGKSQVVSNGQQLTAVPAGEEVPPLGTASLGQVFEGSAPDPLVVARYREGPVAVAVAGRFTNGTRLRRELQVRGALFRSSSEAEVLAHLLAQSSQGTLVNRIVDALWRVEGAFSAVVMTPDRMVVVRDPHGIHTLVVGRIGVAWAVASEDSALWATGGHSVRELARGELAILKGKRCRSVRPFAARPMRSCAQNSVRLAREDARIMGREVYALRRELGERLAADCPVPEDAVVVPLGTGAESCALGFAGAAGCAYAPALRSEMRGWRVRASAVEGRAVALVAMGVVTGADIRDATRLLRDVGCAEVHLRVATPAVRQACIYGVTGPTHDQLAAPRVTSEDELAAGLGLDDIAGLSLDAMIDVLGRDTDDSCQHCLACWNGAFPVVPEEPDDQLPLF